MIQTLITTLLVAMVMGCAASEPANQDYPDPGPLTCIDAWETGEEITLEANLLRKLGSGEPLDIAITPSRLRTYHDKIDDCEDELSDHHHVDAFHMATAKMKLHDLEKYARENPYSFDN